MRNTKAKLKKQKLKSHLPSMSLVKSPIAKVAGKQSLNANFMKLSGAREMEAYLFHFSTRIRKTAS